MVRGDLIRILKQLALKKSKFDYVLIETTGLADPAPVAQTFFVDPDVSEDYALDGIITVVDAKHILLHLDEVKADGVENESIEQVRASDAVLCFSSLIPRRWPLQTASCSTRPIW